MGRGDNGCSFNCCWVTNHVLATQRELKNQQRAALRGYTERQLEELYGPSQVPQERQSADVSPWSKSSGR